MLRIVKPTFTNCMNVGIHYQLFNSDVLPLIPLFLKFPNHTFWIFYQTVIRVELLFFALLLVAKKAVVHQNFQRVQEKQ